MASVLLVMLKNIAISDTSKPLRIKLAVVKLLLLFLTGRICSERGWKRFTDLRRKFCSDGDCARMVVNRDRILATEDTD